jgi:muramoyltetrapeptide carboxypeptidase
VLGHFTRCDSAEGKPSATTAEVLDEYFSGLSIPVVRNLPSGHARPNLSLPLGVEVELDADAGRLSTLESA